MLLRSPGPDQSRHVERAHLSPCLVTQPIQKRLEPTAKARLSNPTFCEPWSAPPKSRPPMSHRKSDLGIPCTRKICQSSASPTLAELLTPLLAADPFSTMRASLRW